uniref:Uncharacterized protein n=1 Tax=Physcomitrium patens TaxID=3218 RepID=A0A2K1J7R2_PHYPA|nr:hypothetical protein PHYPA_020668 [Physcomitrium patens]
MIEVHEVGSSGSLVAIPYKWEVAPGRPIVEAPPVIKPRTSPLGPPPGVRLATKPLESLSQIFEPEQSESTESQLTEKILKKLRRLRSKSVSAKAGFTFDVSEVLEHSGKLFPIEDFDRCYDSDGERRSSVSDHSGALCSSTTIKSSLCESDKGTRYSSIATSSSPCTISAQPSSCHSKDD